MSTFSGGGISGGGISSFDGGLSGGGMSGGSISNFNTQSFGMSGTGGSSFSTANFISIAGAISGAVDTYYAGRVAQAQQKIYSQRAAFNFQQSQIDLKSSFLQQQHSLTMQQFELKAAAFQMQASAIQYQTQAASDSFSASMSELNARQAERDAQGTLLAGERQIGRLTLAAGQQKSSNRASQAARGIVAGVGSAGETEASIDLVKENDMLAIDVNRTREAGNSRLEAVAHENQASFSRQSSSANLLSAQFANQNAAIPNILADVAGTSAAQAGAFAANISTTDIPSFITSQPDINPGRSALISFVGAATPVAAEWYGRKQSLQSTANLTAGY